MLQACRLGAGAQRADRRIAGVVNLLFPGTVQSANCLGDRLGRADPGLRPLLRRDRHPHADHLLPLQRPETYPIHLVRADVAGRAQKLDSAQHRFRPGRAILAFCRTRTYHAHHPDRSSLLLVLQRRSELRLVNGPLDGRIRHRFALLQKPVDPTLLHCRSRRGLLRHDDFGHAQRHWPYRSPVSRFSSSFPNRSK